jgi:hypothetical protein
MMFSIRKNALSVSGFFLLCASVVAMGAGCSTQERVDYDAVNTKPIIGDDAMALRADWPKSVAYYQNGDVAAYSTRYPYQAKEIRSDTGHLILDSVTFVAETAFLPIELIANPPGKSQIFYGVKYPPTYTAQPPLPPSGGNKALNERLYSGGSAAPPKY